MATLPNNLLASPTGATSASANPSQYADQQLLKLLSTNAKTAGSPYDTYGGPAKPQTGSLNAPLAYSPPDLDAQIKALSAPITQSDLTANTRTITSPTAITAPKLNLNLPSFSPNIQAAGQAAIDAGIQGLRSLFQPKYEAERSRISSQGLVGSGVENEAIRRLVQAQGATESQFIGEQTAQMMKEQNAELQALREMQFEGAMKQGDWEQAAAVQNSQLAIDTENLRNQAQQIALSSIEVQRNSQYNGLQARLTQEDQRLEAERVELERQGLLTEERKLELEEQKNRNALLDVIGANAARAGYTGDDFDAYMADQMRNNPDLNDGNSGGAEGSSGGGNTGGGYGGSSGGDSSRFTTDWSKGPWHDGPPGTIKRDYEQNFLPSLGQANIGIRDLAPAGARGLPYQFAVAGFTDNSPPASYFAGRPQSVYGEVRHPGTGMTYRSAGNGLWVRIK